MKNQSFLFLALASFALVPGAHAQFAVPTIQALYPPAMAPSTTVTLAIKGTGFNSSPRLLIDGKLQTLSFQTGTELHVVYTAPSTPASVSVVVQNAMGAPSNVAWLPVNLPSPLVGFNQSAAAIKELPTLAPVFSVLASGDFNGDGFPDLVTASGYPNTATLIFDVTLRVLLNDGNGGFNASTVIDTQQAVPISAIVVGDVNGDGRPDIVFAAGNRIWYALNADGQGTFGTPVDVPYAPGNITKLALVDLDRDGSIDLVAAAGDSVYTFRNVRGIFQSPRSYAAGAAVNAISIGDYNGDGVPDVVASTQQAVVFFFARGDGSLAPATVPDGNAPVFSAAGDFNGDGKLDVAVLHANGSVSSLLGNGAGGFVWSAATPTPDSAPNFLIAAPFSDGGRTDLVLGGNQIRALVAKADGTFTVCVPQTYSTLASHFLAAMAMGDWNHDGRLDVATMLGNQNLGEIVTFTQGPVAVASPSSLAFGSIEVGASSTNQTFTLTNEGSGPMALPVGQPPFPIDKSGCPGPLNSGASCTIAVAFRPTQESAVSGQMQLSQGVVMNMTGTGLAPIASLPTAMQFGNTMVGLSSTAQISLGNTGNQALTINSITISPGGANSHPQDFRVNVTGCASQLPAGATCTISVTFTPSAAAKETASLVVTDNTLNKAGATQTVPITATGFASPTPFLVLSANTLNFGNQAAGSRSAVQLVKVTNLGQQTATFNGILTGNNATDFLLLPGPGTCTYGPPSLPQNASCFVQLAFVPTASGARSGSFILSNSPNALILLNGTGTNGAPLTDIVSPASMLVSNASAGFAVKLAGANLSAASVVSLNGTKLTTSFTGGVLQATVPAGSITAAGTRSLTVANPGTAISNVLMLPVRSAAVAAATFAAAPGSPIGGAQPWHITTGDFNRDGKPDMAVTYPGAVVQILLGNGDGSFRTGQALPQGMVPENGSFQTALPFASATGDFNGDGIPDLVVFSIPDSMVIWLGNGDGTFRPQTVNPQFGMPQGIQVGSGPRYGVVADFNGDGKLDIATSNNGDNNVSVLFGNGDGTFNLVAQPSAGASPWGIAAGDFNGDGNVDLAVALSGANRVVILLGDGHGGFGIASTPTVGASPQGIALGDFNGDGKLDLAVANSGANSVSILLGQGDGTFTAAAPLSAGAAPVSIAVGDLNGDGKLDLAVANSQGASVTVLQGNGNGTFTAVAPASSGNYPWWVAIADWNGDGKLDLATANAGSNSIGTVLGK